MLLLMTPNQPEIQEFGFEIVLMRSALNNNRRASPVVTNIPFKAINDLKSVYEGCKFNKHHPMWLVSMNRRVATYYLRSGEFYQTKPSRLAALEGGFFGTRGSF